MSSPHSFESSDATSRTSGLKTALLFAGGLCAALALANTFLLRVAPAPSHALGGAFDRYPARLGDIAYTVRGSGPPLLLLHGWGAGNSMIEWAHNIEDLAERHTVFALDFPGWGLSDKPRIAHTAESYIEMVLFFLQDIVREPCALIASSGACGVAIEAAARAPELISSLVLVCPSEPRGVGEKGASDPTQVARQMLLRAPGLSTAFYLSLTSRASIEKFSREQLFFDADKVSSAWVNRCYANAHQLDAPHAVYSFLAGALDIDAREAWSRLEQPALLVWGRNARLSPLDAAPEWMALKLDARLAVIDNAMQLPHAEHPASWNRTVKDFLASALSSAPFQR